MITDNNNKSGNQEQTIKKELQISIRTTVISFLITLPVYLIIRDAIPNLYWPFYIDSILIFLLNWGLVYLLVNAFKKITYVVFAIMIIFLLIGSIRNKYGFLHFFSDYKTLVRDLNKSDKPIKALTFAITPDATDSNQELVDKIIITERIIEKSKALSYEFDLNTYDKTNLQKIIKAFSIFKKVKRNWTFLKDNFHYTATSEESCISDSGDLDDYAIYLCSLLKANQNEVRIIKEKDILHPQLLIGVEQDKQIIRKIIKMDLFYNESLNQDVVFHTDPEGRVWISLSFYGNFPGRKLDYDNNTNYIVITVGNNVYTK